MSKITDYTALSSADSADVLLIVDTDDTTMAPSGTTKKIKVSALLAQSITNVSGNASITPASLIYLVNAASGNLTLTLPAPAGVTGVPFWIKRTDNSTNYVTVNPNAGELIDNGLHGYMANSDAALTLVSDGTNWWSF